MVSKVSRALHVPLYLNGGDRKEGGEDEHSENPDSNETSGFLWLF